MLFRFFGIITILALFYEPSSSVPSRKAPCPYGKEYITPLDSAGKVLLMVGDRSFHFPTTIEEINNDRCPKAKNSIEVIKKIYSHCLEPFPAQIIRYLIHGAKKVVKKLCKNDPIEQQKMLELGKCALGHEEKLHKHMDLYIDQMEYVRDNIPEKDNDLKIPFSCCYYHELKKNTLDEARGFCGQNSIDYVTQIVDDLMTDVLDLNCSKHTENSTLCDTLMKDHPLPLSFPDKTTRADSPLSPLNDIYTSL